MVSDEIWLDLPLVSVHRNFSRFTKVISARLIRGIARSFVNNDTLMDLFFK